MSSSRPSVSKIKTLNASLLVVGTSVGAGMLGLPVETGGGGFLPAFIFLVLNWLIMTGTALMLIELLSHYKENTNFISLSEKLLGKPFKIITFIVYIGLFLSLTMAYVKGGGVFIADSFNHMPIAFGCLIFLVIFVPLIALGSRILSVGNSVLTFILIGSFIILILLGLNKIDGTLLRHVSWKLGILSYPMFITSFGFHSILPSLSTYVGNKKSLRWAVVIGTSITFLIYFSWQLVVMGIVPLDGEHGLLNALAADQTAVSPLKHYLKSPLIVSCAQIFYFSALTTSFLGVGLGLVDFIFDSFNIQRKVLNRFLVCMLIYVPALWAAQTSLRIFYLSLKFGGGFACLYLLIILPILLFIKYKKLENSKEIRV